MEIQLSSGQGPAECELAVAKLLAALLAEFPDIQILARAPGIKPGTLRSARLQSDADLSFLEGTVQWVCQSPYRPKHKRKNWFVDVSLCTPQKRRHMMKARCVLIPSAAAARAASM